MKVQQASYAQKISTRSLFQRLDSGCAGAPAGRGVWPPPLIGSGLPSMPQPSRAAASGFAALHTGMCSKVYIKLK